MTHTAHADTAAGMASITSDRPEYHAVSDMGALTSSCDIAIAVSTESSPNCRIVQINKRLKVMLSRTETINIWPVAVLPGPTKAMAKRVNARRSASQTLLN